MHCRQQDNCHNICNQTCPLYPFKDGKVPDQYKRHMTQSQLDNLSKSPRNGKALKAKQLEEQTCQDPVWRDADGKVID